MKNEIITEEDKNKLFDMGETLNSFLKKYRGYSVNIITTLYHKDGQLQNQVRIDLAKIIEKEL